MKKHDFWELLSFCTAIVELMVYILFLFQVNYY